MCYKFNIEWVSLKCNFHTKCTNNCITLGNRKKLIYYYLTRINGGVLLAGEIVDIYSGEIVEKEEFYIIFLI